MHSTIIKGNSLGLGLGCVCGAIPEPEAPLTTAAVAAALGVSRQTVRNLAEAGTLPGHRVGDQWRFWWSELAAAGLAPAP